MVKMGVGAAVGAMTANLLTRPQQASASPDMDLARIDARLAAIESALSQGTDSQALADIKASMQLLVQIQALGYILDPFRYITQKVRSGEAQPMRGSYYQMIAPGATFTNVVTMPQDYVWIGQHEVMHTSQNGVIEITILVDDLPQPWIYVPRAWDIEYHWSVQSPYDRLIKNQATTIFTNHDALQQWIIGGFLGVLIRKDVWDRDSALMDNAARKLQVSLETI